MWNSRKGCVQYNNVSESIEMILPSNPMIFVETSDWTGSALRNCVTSSDSSYAVVTQSDFIRYELATNRVAKLHVQHCTTTVTVLQSHSI